MDRLVWWIVTIYSVAWWVFVVMLMVVWYVAKWIGFFIVLAMFRGELLIIVPCPHVPSFRRPW